MKDNWSWDLNRGWTLTGKGRKGGRWEYKKGGRGKNWHEMKGRKNCPNCGQSRCWEVPRPPGPGSVVHRGGAHPLRPPCWRLLGAQWHFLLSCSTSRWRDQRPGFFICLNLMTRSFLDTCFSIWSVFLLSPSRHRKSPDGVRIAEGAERSTEGRPTKQRTEEPLSLRVVREQRKDKCAEWG